MGAERGGPAGRLVPVAGRTVHVLDVGTSGEYPTVVFESGLATPLQGWTWVQRAIAAHTRTISYERAGTAWSRRGSGARSVPRLADELHQLLTALAVDRPIILVGHSFGGLITRCYAGRYPAGIAGVVFVDALHPEEMRRSAMQRRGMAWLEQSLAVTAVKTALRLGRRSTDTLFPELPEPARQAARAGLRSTLTWRTAAAELVAWKNTDPRDVATADFPQDSVVGVVTSGESLRNDVAHRKLQEDLLTLSGNSFAVRAEGAGHFDLILDSEHAEGVVNTIRAVLEQTGSAVAPAQNGGRRAH